MDLPQQERVRHAGILQSRGLPLLQRLGGRSGSQHVPMLAVHTVCISSALQLLCLDLQLSPA